MTDVLEASVVGVGLSPELVSTPEWNSVCTGQYNVIFEGPAHATEGLLLLLEPHLRTPVIWKWGHMPFEPPTHVCGAVILQDVSALSGHEQATLADWLDASSHRTQVVSTTSHPLFPLVACGLFDEALYYRLNVILLSIDSTGAPVS